MRWFKRLLQGSKDKTNNEQRFERHDIEGLFAELQSTFLRMSRLKQQVKDVEEIRDCLEHYKLLSKTDKQTLDKLSINHKAALDERKHLQNRLVRTNPALHRFAEYDKELSTLVPEIKRVENQVNLYEQNIEYLTDEQEYLINDRELLLQGYKYLRIFTVIFSVLLVTVLFLSFAMLQVVRENIWLNITISCLIFLLVVWTILSIKEKLERELKRNELLQQKVAQYLNKTKIHYFNAKQFVDFEFNKLGVDSMIKLEQYYARYEENKGNEKTYNNLMDKVTMIEEKIELLLKQNYVSDRNLRRIIDWIVTPRRREEDNALFQETERALKQLEGLEEYEKELNKQILAYSSIKEYTDIIEMKLQEYEDFKENFLTKPKPLYTPKQSLEEENI
ncbi:hypothetical protein AN639_11840 [Candidatus Epulonipiscium fishelsonii]|uniref:Uncharacterized protein n=1 Tax=Candidatus Epulonipiscium fishelsonii TaxID=77094 RepID=A0ACC8XG92_9FIRM|nr:hypothetical protein AN396_02150 [Epulopiscium sp. SCG-B11WGA-EpuloA1]ONI42857.1 hypothetical protein AN639_11840 [Epulopiscium sp. SCG-B05WGA-EpuloA1]ONI47648.1 hypothetical protein AN644_04435 [Epulopiscium sp. SCG-C06WGA-EpuloA1]